MNCEATNDHSTPVAATLIVGFGDHTFNLCDECAMALMDAEPGARVLAPLEVASY